MPVKGGGHIFNQNVRDDVAFSKWIWVWLETLFYLKKPKIFDRQEIVFGKGELLDVYVPEKVQGKNYTKFLEEMIAAIRSSIEEGNRFGGRSRPVVQK